jgi:hypothetical protein
MSKIQKGRAYSILHKILCQCVFWSPGDCVRPVVIRGVLFHHHSPHRIPSGRIPSTPTLFLPPVIYKFSPADHVSPLRVDRIGSIFPILTVTVFTLIGRRNPNVVSSHSLKWTSLASCATRVSAYHVCLGVLRSTIRG